MKIHSTSHIFSSSLSRGRTITNARDSRETRNARNVRDIRDIIGLDEDEKEENEDDCKTSNCDRQHHSHQHPPPQPPKKQEQAKNKTSSQDNEQQREGRKSRFWLEYERQKIVKHLREPLCHLLRKTWKEISHVNELNLKKCMVLVPALFDDFFLTMREVKELCFMLQEILATTANLPLAVSKTLQIPMDDEQSRFFWVYWEDSLTGKPPPLWANGCRQPDCRYCLSFLEEEENSKKEKHEIACQKHEKEETPDGNDSTCYLGFSEEDDDDDNDDDDDEDEDKDDDDDGAENKPNKREEFVESETQRTWSKISETDSTTSGTTNNTIAKRKIQPEEEISTYFSGLEPLGAEFQEYKSSPACLDMLHLHLRGISNFQRLCYQKLQNNK